MSDKELGEAIETLELNLRAREASLGSDASNTPLLRAQRLGIEALERLQETRNSNPEAMPKVAHHSYLQLLPSETD